MAGSDGTVWAVPVTEEDMVFPTFKKIHFYLMCMGVWPTCVSVYHVCAEARREQQSVPDSYELLMGAEN